MTSLYPGMLFYSSGLNKKSTPYGPDVTPSEIDQKLGRVPYNGRPWPKSSPVSTIYDVRNSSTRMIILNNKLSKRPKGSRLRGQSDYQGDIQQPEPLRHVTDDSHTNWEHHKGCTTSVSEKFIPVYPRGASASLPEWVNKTQRPAMKFDNGSGVNPNHHIQCQGHIDYDIVRWYNNHRRPRAQSRTSSVRDSRAMSPILNDPNLSRGEKRYLNSIAKIYSVDNMRLQKQHQYNQLMYQEMNKGLSRQADWQKYHRYLNTPRKTQFGPCDPKRSQSVAGKRSSKEITDEGRPNTTQTGARPIKGSRGVSTSGSTRKSNQKGQQNQKGGALRGRDSDRKKNEDLTGKPARVESPLPLKPKRDSSLSSLSSLSSNDENEEDNKTKEEAKETEKKEEEKQVSPPQERGKRDDAGSDKIQLDNVEERSRKVSDEKEKTGDKKEDENRTSDDDKRKEDDEDERSKMSARAEDDQPGRGVEYVPLYGQRQGEDGNDYDRSLADNRNRKKSSDESDTEKPEHFRPKSPEESKNNKANSPENSVVLLPPSTKANERTTSDSDKSQDDDSNGPELVHHKHKEGGDRPLSRLGGRGQFTLVKKGSDANSDDDYSDDDEKDTVDNPSDQQRGGNTDVDGNEVENATDVRLSLHKEDGGPGSNHDDNADESTTASAMRKDSLTGASNEEKHSTITTVEY